MAGGCGVCGCFYEGFSDAIQIGKGRSGVAVEEKISAHDSGQVELVVFIEDVGDFDAKSLAGPSSQVE
ncbi:hypothetical protein L2331_10890 [Mesorhizobium muleiense]|nr:hypothetical protein [Mesorhizobium muleiense]MCF6110407.1 hypothetical protein [Mesorhizobium muleiense]